MIGEIFFVLWVSTSGAYKVGAIELDTTGFDSSVLPTYNRVCNMKNSVLSIDVATSTIHIFRVAPEIKKREHQINIQEINCTRYLSKEKQEFIRTPYSGTLEINAPGNEGITSWCCCKNLACSVCDPDCTY